MKAVVGDRPLAESTYVGKLVRDGEALVYPGGDAFVRHIEQPPPGPVGRVRPGPSHAVQGSGAAMPSPTGKRRPCQPCASRGITWSGLIALAVVAELSC